jgi:hypothetical protein
VVFTLGSFLLGCLLGYAIIYPTNHSGGLFMGCDVFHSSLGRFYRQEDIYLSFTLHKCSDVVYVRDYDIEVCVYTSQLSTRLWVVDYSRGFVPESDRKKGDSSAYIVRGRESWSLVMTPDFLRYLAPGVLTCGIHYVGSSFDTASVVHTDELLDIRV